VNHLPTKFLMAALLLLAQAASAQNQPLWQMQHSTWAGHDGAPLGIDAVAMSPDGLIYLAGISGVYRFDGVVFEPVTLPDVRVTSTIHDLLFTRKGGLLLMFSHGAPVLIREGHGRFLGRTEGDAIDVIGHAQETPDGQLWALLNERKLVFLGTDDVWHTATDPGAGHTHITQLFVDAHGITWLISNDRLYRKPPQGEFEPTDIFVYGTGKFMDGLDSDVWIASDGLATSAARAHHLQHVDRSGKPLKTRDVSQPLTAAFESADGSIWLLTSVNELVHLPAGLLERGSSLLNLSKFDNRVALRTATEGTEYAFSPSSDGSIWIGGSGGLEHFQSSTVVPLLPNAASGLWQHCLERDGSQWIFDPRGDLYLRSSSGAMRFMKAAGNSLDCSAYGSLLHTGTGLSTLGKEHVEPLPEIRYFKGYRNHYMFTGSTRSSDGSVVAAAAGGAIGRSLWRYRSGNWQRILLGQQISELSAMYSTPKNEVFLGFRDGTIALLKPESNEVHPIGKVANTEIAGFTWTQHGLLVYCTDGVAIQSGDSFIDLPFANPQSSTLITGLTESPNGDLWLNAEMGIVRVAASELETALRDRSHRIQVNDLPEGDYVGPTLNLLFSQSAQTDAQGRIWFNTLNGIVSINPAELKSFQPPHLVIKDVSADGAQLPENRTLPPGLSSLNIRYIGVDFSDPSGVSYSYKLSGYDTEWQDVGTRTEAVYTHLRAGEYTFAVRARNAFGSWTTPITLKPIKVRPRFYETGWFVLAVVLLAVVLVLSGVHIRVRIAAADIRRRAEERADERINIARDLHDTLLQGVQGLLMTFHAATEGVPSDHPSKPSLEHALSSAEKLIVEGRDRVKGLRDTRLSSDDLGQLFQSVADDLACADRFHLISSNDKEETVLRDDVAGEFFLIGREAIINAVHHAQASRITLRLRYNTEAFSLECEDDGVGFDLPKSKMGKCLHWGIAGMKERIEALHGSLHIRTTPGEGTLIQAYLPATYAYK
jgi:signal transduction histidine kinase/ligand-binding sensor domain-containing protein